MKVAGGRSGEAAAGSPGGSNAAAVPEVNLSNNFCLYANRSIRSIAGIRAPGSVGGCELIFFFFGAVPVFGAAGRRDERLPGKPPPHTR